MPSDTRFHRAAPAIRNLRRRARRPRGQPRSDRRGPRARTRTHRSGRYRSDLSRDPPSAAASAHETHRVLPGSCKPVPAGHLPLSRRSREGASAFSCLSHGLAARGKAIYLQESLDGERRTRTADTTIFSRAVLALKSGRFAGIFVGLEMRRSFRAFPDFAPVSAALRHTAGRVCRFVASRKPLQRGER
jgi:hypothetical protein